MKKLLGLTFFVYFTLNHRVFALTISQGDIGFFDRTPKGQIISVNDGNTVVQVLTMIQSILLKVVMPIVVVGAGLYIAYQLFTAEGDETKLKRAWKSIAYTAIALISIAVSYAFVSIVARISV